MRQSVTKTVIAIIAATSIFVVCGQATPRTWDGGGGDGNWFNPVNWDGDTSYPQAGDGVTLSNGVSVLLSNDTAFLDSFVITNATLMFTNWMTTLIATNITIQDGGKLTVPYPFDYSPPEMSNRVHIVSEYLVIDAGGSINVNAGGYAVTQGPGEGKESGSNNNSGGGHGGRGGDESGGVGGVTS